LVAVQTSSTGEAGRSDETRRVAWAVFLLAMSLLAFELITTRLFAVIIWNHFAFLAISIGLFGFGVAGVAVYVFPRFFRPERAYAQLTATALLLPVTIWLVVIVLCALPIKMSFNATMFHYLRIVFLLTSLPFAVGGVGITLALLNWRESINRIYAFDLVGSALGCLLVIALLGALDGPTAALAIGLLPIGAALVLRPSWLALLLAVIVVGGVAVNHSDHWVRIKVARSKVQAPLYEEWNAFSRVTVARPHRKKYRGWWVAPDSDAKPIDGSLSIFIDGNAMTPMLLFDGDLEKVAIVLHDITAPAYHLRPNADDVLIIGPGGGKDVLAALASGAKRVKAAELNPIIARSIVSERFREFSGDIYHHPNVDLVVSEGRTAVRHDPTKYDIVSIALVDTSTAAAAGAYALTENSLYTVDAAQEFFEHLREDGVLTATSRNMAYLQPVTRLISIYREALLRMGATQVADKMAVLSATSEHLRFQTILVRPTGFSAEDASRVMALAEQYGFVPIYVPGHDIPASDEYPSIATYRELLTREDLSDFYESYIVDLRPVDDDRPFFFYQNRIRDMGSVLTTWNPGFLYGNGLFVISKVLVISALAVALFLILPLLVAKQAAMRDFQGSAPYFVYFLCLGAGFITLEVALVQMFGYYLGHPLLGLGVSLATMLLTTGIGSGLGGS
jgi:hypothetical protein